MMIEFDGNARVIRFSNNARRLSSPVPCLSNGWAHFKRVHCTANGQRQFIKRLKTHNVNHKFRCMVARIRWMKDIDVVVGYHAMLGGEHYRIWCCQIDCPINWCEYYAFCMLRIEVSVFDWHINVRAVGNDASNTSNNGRLMRFIVQCVFCIIPGINVCQVDWLLNATSSSSAQLLFSSCDRWPSISITTNTQLLFKCLPGFYTWEPSNNTDCHSRFLNVQYLCASYRNHL